MMCCVTATSKKFFALCALAGALTLTACDQSKPTAMSTPTTSPAAASQSQAHAALAPDTTEDLQQPVDTVRDFEDFRINASTFAFRADDTTCWVDIAAMNPQCALVSTAGTPPRVVFSGGEWKTVNEGPGATPVPRNVNSLNRGETLSIDALVAHHSEDGTLRLSFPRDPAVPPLAIRDNAIVGE